MGSQYEVELSTPPLLEQNHNYTVTAPRNKYAAILLYTHCWT